MENCVYRFLDEDYKTIYVGKAKDLIKRLKNHKHLPKECYDETVIIEYCKCISEDDSLFLERYLISKLKPKYNATHKNHNIKMVLDELENGLWIELDKNILNKPRKEIQKIQHEIKKETIKQKKSMGRFEYSKNKTINDLIKNYDITESNNKKARELFYEKQEKIRQSLTRKEKEERLKALINKRKVV